MTGVEAADLVRACALLYPGLFADEAYRRHPQQIDRVAAALIEQAAEVARLRETVARVEALHEKAREVNAKDRYPWQSDRYDIVRLSDLRRALDGPDA